MNDEQVCGIVDHLMIQNSEIHVDQEELFAYFKQSAAEVDAAMLQDLAVVQNAELLRVLKHALFNGGKRVRPLLTVLTHHLSCRKNGREITSKDKMKAIRLGMTIEYLHAASLLHDDVIDQAQKRRGKDSANVVWGTNPVILAGDFLHARAMQVAAGTGGVASQNIVSQAVCAMIEAEFLQKRIAEAKDRSEEKYFAVLAGKTAALIAAAAEVGTVMAGGGVDEQRAAVEYGGSLGLAFQVVDDLLDYLGDPARTGKAVGNDLVEGKMTLPVIYALAGAADGDRNRLEEILVLPREKRLARFVEAQELLAANQGFARAAEKARSLVDTALAGLAVFPDCRQKRILTGLAEYVLVRDR